MTITIYLEPETTLSVSAPTGGSCTVIRSPNTPGESIPESGGVGRIINLASGCTVEVGPFSQTRRYIISSIVGEVTYSYSKNRVNYNYISSGVYTGGFLSINSGDNTKFDISAGSGIICDNYTNPENPPEIFKITWPAYEALDVTYLAADFTSHVGIDAGGNVVQYTSTLQPSNRRDDVILGLLVHTSGVQLESVGIASNIGYDVGNLVSDMNFAIGGINLTGNKFSASGSNLKLAKSAGTSYRMGANRASSSKSPNIRVNPSLTDPTLFKPYKSGTVDGDGNPEFTIDVPLTDTVDPTKYDDGSGTLATIAGNRWAVHRVYLGQENDDVIVQYPQNVYNNKNLALKAINSETHDTNPVLNEAQLRGYIIIRSDCTALNNTSKCEFIAADKYGILPAESTSLPFNSGAIETDTTMHSSDFDAVIGTSYMIDNSSGSVTMTLPESTAETTGQAIEVWITASTATHNVIIEAYDYTHSINGVSGSNPDPVQATISSLTQAYSLVTIRFCNAGSYMISHADTVST